MSTGSLLLAHDRPSTSTALQNVSTLIEIQGLEFNRADTMEECVLALERSNLPTFPDPADGSLWCNATFDTVLCWPATPANTSITLRCPPLKGLDPERSVVKYCEESGRWAGSSPGVYENPWGWTNYTGCFIIKLGDLKWTYACAKHLWSCECSENISKWCHSSGRWMGREEGDFSRAHGWTNFTMCFTQEVIDMMTRLTNGSLGIAQEVARNARKLEFVGLGLSLVSLLISIAIFSYFRRLRVFRNLLHLQLMIAILMVVVIRLVLYIDLIFTDRLGPAHTNPDGKTINTMVFVCEAMFFLLEYFKTVAFGWMFLEGFYLHNQLVFTVFNSEPRLTPYLIAGYGFPLAHTFLWLGVILFKKQGKVERCLGSYYLEPEFWILDGPRMFELVATALMLIPLLGIPNIMQTIPFSPTQENIMVQNVLKTCYGRYRLQHTSTNELRRGSRTVSAHYQTKNGVLMTTINGNTLISPYQSMNKKISCDTTADVVAPIVQQRPQEVTTNNGSVTLDDYATTTVSERTPLRNVGRCDSENVSVDNNDRYHSISRDRTR
ncbi:unnamed protein product [Toxocara canis]|uniref:Calcitonin receptor n=1 Tax=Toxocara canis TaxID=6265 RepID=A0A183UBR7_TOXCA|nr:unnamed protein product [Toxocara canis]